MKIQTEPERAELLEKIPELSIFLTQAEMNGLAPLWRRIRSQFPQNPYIVTEAPVSESSSVFCYAPTAAEKEAFLRIRPNNSTESDFLKLLAEFPV